MNEEKVIFEIQELMCDPLQYEVGKHIINRIENKSPLGKILVKLLILAENGKFK